MRKTVFFSWQLDTPATIGRNFIKESLELACRDIASRVQVNEADRDLFVDSDTKDVPGQPPIADTIFKKIDSAGVYVADLTFIGRRINGRLTPNPNVLIEYGWALKSLGFERIICIMNEAYGEPSDANLPFNLKHVRWPKTFNLSEKATPNEIGREKATLVKYLIMAIKASLATIPEVKEDAPLAFSERKSLDGPSRFRVRAEEIGIEDGFIRSGLPKKLFLQPGPSMWLRVMPVNDPGKKLRIHGIKECARENLSKIVPLVNQGSGFSFLRARDGIGTYYNLPQGQEVNSDVLNIESLTFIFESCEIWSVDVSLLTHDPENIFYANIQEAFTEGLRNYSSFLRKLGIKGQLKWKAGLVDIKNRRLVYPLPRGSVKMAHWPVCLLWNIENEGQIIDNQNPITSLLPFYENIFNSCGLPRPDYLGE